MHKLLCCNIGTAEVQHEPILIEYDLQSTSTGVCITCTFLNSSTTDCVAVVHQRISQLSSSGLMNIESSQKFTRSGDTASGCIVGVNLEVYQVGVVPEARQLVTTDLKFGMQGGLVCICTVSTQLSITLCIHRAINSLCVVCY